MLLWFRLLFIWYNLTSNLCFLLLIKIIIYAIICLVLFIHIYVTDIQTQWEGLKKQGGKPEGFLSEVVSFMSFSSSLSSYCMSFVIVIWSWSFCPVYLKLLHFSSSFQRTARDDANRENNRAVSNVADMKIWYMFVIMKMLQTLHDLEFVRLCACVHRECGFVSTLSMVSSLGLCYDAGPFRHTTFTIGSCLKSWKKSRPWKQS